MANPEGELPSHSSGTEILCLGCRDWFTASEIICPFCAHPRPGYNPHIRRQKLEAHTLGMAQHAKENH